MKKLLPLFTFLILVTVSNAQVFPGLNDSQKRKLLASGIKIPLPGWIPAGFLLDTFEVKTGKNILVQNKVLYVQYTKKLNDSTWQSFIVEAAFDGLGSLWYESETVQSAVGKIEFYYQPDEKGKDGKTEKIQDLILTEWFEVNKVSFHVLSIVATGEEFEVMGDENETENKYNYVPISKEDFRKILQSMQVLK